MADLISRVTALDKLDVTMRITAPDDYRWRIPETIEKLPTVDAIPVEYLMNYAQLPTEFAIAAWRKQDKDAQEKRIKRLDKPMSLDDALNLVNKVFSLGQKEQEAR